MESHRHQIYNLSTVDAEHMTPEEIEIAVANVTFFTILMNDVDITVCPSGDGKTALSLKFPSWFDENLTEETKELVKARIRSHAQEAVDSSLP